MTIYELIFFYNFLFVVYFYSNKIWCIEKLVLQYTIKPIDFTGMSTFQEYNSHFRVGAKYKSFTDLECTLKKF
jgi:hypothetical protein